MRVTLPKRRPWLTGGRDNGLGDEGGQLDDLGIGQASSTQNHHSSPIPSYINAVLRGDESRPLHADDGGDRCYAPDAGRAIALLMTTETLRHDTDTSPAPDHNREFAGSIWSTTPSSGWSAPKSGTHPVGAPGRPPGRRPGDDAAPTAAPRRMFRYETGRAARYSNVGYLAAAQFIAAVTGTPFQQLV